MKEFDMNKYYNLVKEVEVAFEKFKKIKVKWEDKDILKRISNGLDKIIKDFDKDRPSYDEFFINYIIGEINKLAERK